MRSLLLFDRCLAEAYHRASRDLKEFRLAVARSTNEKVQLFREIGRVVLDPQVNDADLRRTIYRRIPPAELRNAVEESDRIIRPLDDHYFELCVLWELRGALRAGDVWLEGSRRHADPQTYLIRREQWPGLRAEVCREIQAPEDGTNRLRDRERELTGLLDRVEGLLAQGGDVRMEGDGLVVSPLEAEQKPESTVELERLIDERLPSVELSELFIEVNGWTHFIDDFEHAGGTEPRSRELPCVPNLHSSRAAADGFAVDFRDIYATLLRGWLNIDPAPVLGRRNEDLAIF